MVHLDSYGVSRVPQYLGNPTGDYYAFTYRAVTFYGALFQEPELQNASVNV